VTGFSVGDRVVASTGAGLGANAELARVPADGAIGRIPESASDEDAVTICEGGLTALPFLRDAGRIAPGERVLINGASGAVGTAAVQLAKHFGAHVTGVCGPAGVELVESIGADEVIDYRTTDFTTAGHAYDIVFDVAGKSSFSRCRHSLNRGGRYLRTVPSLAIAAQSLVTRWAGSRRATIMFTGLRKPADKARDLAFLMDLLETGRMRAVVGRRFRLEDSVAAHRFVEGDGKQGSVVLTV
jgi:NADPH:quinone reductase-like Zn-dependent oxidoreductase